MSCAEVKAVFEGPKQSVSLDLILTHSRKDAHQDYRLTAEMTWNTFRDHLILEYIMDAFQSQHSKRWFREDTFLSLMRLRGMECNAPSGYAEAFYCRKMVL